MTMEPREKNYNQPSDHSAKNQEPPKRDLSQAPVWRFVLPFLVVFLALGQGQDSWANDSGLYQSEIPENATMLRIVHFSHSATGEVLEVKVGAREFAVQGNSVSPFELYSSGNIIISYNNKTFDVALEDGDRLTLGFMSKTENVQHLGFINTPAQMYKMKSSKAGLHLFNFVDQASVNLTTGNGKHEIITSTYLLQSNFRAVNPIPIAMRINKEKMAVYDLPRMKFMPDKRYSFLVGGTDAHTITVFAEDQITQP